MRELFGSRAGEASSSSQASTGKDGGPASSTGSTQEKEEQKTAEGPGASEGASARPGVVERVRRSASAALREMRLALREETPAASALRGAPKGGELKTAETTALAHHSVEEPAWQRQWRDLRAKLGAHPAFARLSTQLDQHLVAKGRDVAESLRERWETSDSPLVHRLQDAADSWAQESEHAAALREIRARDPGFDVVRFLAQVRADVPVVIRAYLTGDEAVIHEHCSPEMVERLTGIWAATSAAGQVPDATLLDTSDVELVDLKVGEQDQPLVVVQFTCQQINCTRDSFGNVVEGAPDDVHRVYYFWALQQEPQGYVGTDGQYHPPRWQLREMAIRGMHHLL